jgi:hypothetical protein
MRVTSSYLGVVSLLAGVYAASDKSNLGWHFVQNGTTGILALEAMVVSPTLILMFDRVEENPMLINNHSAWAALWNLETNTASPLDVITDTFCASGSFLSNGTMVSSYSFYNTVCLKLCRSAWVGTQSKTQIPSPIRMVEWESVYSALAKIPLAQTAQCSRIRPRCT